MKFNAWQDFLNGDEDSFSLIYNTYFQGLYAYAIRLGFDEEIAKDTIHDVFFYIYTSKAKLEHVEDIQLYLLVSLKNRLFNIYKREGKKNAQTFSDIKVSEEESDTLNRIINEELDKQLKDEIKVLLKKLKPKQRQVIYYRFALNMKYSEIATILDLKPDSVKKILQRTLVELRKEKPRLAEILRFIIFISTPL